MAGGTRSRRRSPCRRRTTTSARTTARRSCRSTTALRSSRSRRSGTAIAVGRTSRAGRCAARETRAGLADGASYRMTALISGFCLDVVNGARRRSQHPAVGLQRRQRAAVHGRRCRPMARHSWSTSAADCARARSAIRMRPAATSNNSRASGATRWKLANIGMGYYVVQHAGTSSCLDVAGGSGTMGANIQQWSCNDLSPQIWRFDP